MNLSPTVWGHETITQGEIGTTETMMTTDSLARRLRIVTAGTDTGTEIEKATALPFTTVGVEAEAEAEVEAGDEIVHPIMVVRQAKRWYWKEYRWIW